MIILISLILGYGIVQLIIWEETYRVNKLVQTDIIRFCKRNLHLVRTLIITHNSFPEQFINCIEKWYDYVE